MSIETTVPTLIWKVRHDDSNYDHTLIYADKMLHKNASYNDYQAIMEMNVNE